MGVPRTESPGHSTGSRSRPSRAREIPGQGRRARSADDRPPGGRPAPEVRRDSLPPAARRAPTWRERLDESFPLLFFGGASLVMALVALLTNTQIGSTRYPLWVLFLGLGSIATLGGTAAVLAEDDEADLLQDALESGEFIAVPREELAELRRAAGIPDGTSMTLSVPPRAGRDGRPMPGSTSPGMAPRPAGGAFAATPDRPPRERAPDGPRDALPWEERETDAEDPASSGIPDVRASRPVEDEVETLLAELERNIAFRTGAPPAPTTPRSRTSPAVSPEGSTRFTGEDPDLNAALSRIERSLPATAPDPADAWIDRASLPQEFSRLLSEMYPPERSGRPDLRGTSRPVDRADQSGRCSHCKGRLLSSTGECSVCHSPLCRTCAGLLSLTSEKPICDRCAHAA